VIPHWLHPLIARLPAERRAQLRRVGRPAYMGMLRRTRPLSDRYGFERGRPVDRYYIEAFLAQHAADVRGRGIEVKNANYLRRYDSGLIRCDVLDIDPANPQATLICDLAVADGVPDALFDCFVLTQTLHVIYNWQAALQHAWRMLRPGGVLLATVPAVSRVDYTLAEIDYWRFTPRACQLAFGEVFGDEQVTVKSYGNVLTATAFLMGMAAEDLRTDELDRVDPAFPVLIGIRAQRA
jgi:SAM-dependent methyltransferase